MYYQTKYYGYKNTMHNIILGDDSGGVWTEISFQQYTYLLKKEGGYILKKEKKPLSVCNTIEPEINESFAAWAPLVIALVGFALMVVAIGGN